MRKLQKKLSLTALPFAFIFLANPCVSVIDAMPDLFGYILLLWGLRYVADMSSDIDEAREAFKKMVYVECARLAAIVYIIGLSASSDEKNSVMMVTVFVLSIIEIIVLVPAYRHLFTGIGMLAIMNGEDASFNASKNANEYRSDKARRAAVIFVIFKAVMTTLPELSVLTYHGYDDTVFPLHKFTGMFRTLSVMLMSLVGLCFLMRMLAFFIRMLRDTKFIECVKERYISEVIPNGGRFARREISAALSMFTVACLLTLDFYADDMNLLPDAVAAIFFAVSFIMMRRYFRRYLIGVGASALYCAASVANWIARYDFYQNNHETLVWVNTEDYRAYFSTMPYAILEALGFLATVGVMLYALISLINDHTGYVYEHAPTEYSESKCREIRRGLKLRLIPFIIASLLYAACCIVYFYAITEPDTTPTAMILSLVTLEPILLYITASRARGDIIFEVKNKYLLS